MTDKKLFYLSGTGNSLKVAKDLQSRLGECTLHSLPSTKAHLEGDTVGLVFPIYFARPPAYVQEFIERATFGDISYLFLVATGGGMFGTALKQLEATLRTRGQTVDAGFLIGMPGNHPKIAALQWTKPETHFAREKRRVGEIADLVRDKESRRIETNFGPIGRLFARMTRQPYQLSKARRLDEAFVLTERCTGCGTCETVCPVGNIQRDASTGRPSWKHHCISCLGCYHHCPREAIEVSGMKQMKRYRHPEISLRELMG